MVTNMASGWRSARGLRQLFKGFRQYNPYYGINNTPITPRASYLRVSSNGISGFSAKITESFPSTYTGNNQRQLSTEQPITTQDPFKLVEPDLLTLCDDIKLALRIEEVELEQIAQYHFDGEGKAFRPMIVLLMAKACNQHVGTNASVFRSQRTIAMISEMIHTASLIHDDVIDEAFTRRGHESVQAAWGQRKAILAGDYILSIATGLLARIRNPEVVEVLAQVLEDLVRGEFMQLGSKEDETERFNHYLLKTFKKTASLIAHSCKAVSILSQGTDDMIDTAYQYGRNVGIAFQLVDDLLDFVSSEQMMGKPTAADLKLGLATAPVLFAAQQFPELNPMIMRRFTNEGDVEEARRIVAKSSGVEQTRYLAESHCKEAVRLALTLTSSPERDALITITHKVINRLR